MESRSSVSATLPLDGLECCTVSFVEGFVDRQVIQLYYYLAILMHHLDSTLYS